MNARLRAAGHELVLSDLNQLPDVEAFVGLPFIQCDVQAGFGLKRAIAGCDLLVSSAFARIFPGSAALVEKYGINIAQAKS